MARLRAIPSADEFRTSAGIRNRPAQLYPEEAKYSWHGLRHYSISAWLAAGIDPKTVQRWAGPATLALSLDTHGHMIPRADDHARIAVAERGAGA